MNFIIANYVCGSCGSQYELPAVPPAITGRFLLWDSMGDARCLDAFNDGVFDEYDNIIKSIKFCAALPRRSQVNLIRSSFGEVACDPSSNGMALGITRLPSCSNCGLSELFLDTFKVPTAFSDHNFLPVSHNEWRALSSLGKKVRCEKYLKHIGAFGAL